jgi:hypothetical protein
MGNTHKAVFREHQLRIGEWRMVQLPDVGSLNLQQEKCGCVGVFLSNPKKIIYITKNDNKHNKNKTSHKPHPHPHGRRGRQPGAAGKRGTSKSRKGKGQNRQRQRGTARPKTTTAPRDRGAVAISPRFNPKFAYPVNTKGRTNK